MTFKELFAQFPFSEIYKEIDMFTERKLGQYILRLETTGGVKTGHKEIFDAVWGNVDFSSGEIAILDSPLLQRLRKIKQLGLAHYVYCGCDYSRYFHTIGVVFLADRMATAINHCDIKWDDKEYFKAVIRLAAIFHDVGHMFLSHVSEHFFGKSVLYPRNEEIRTMLEQFETSAGKSASLHELLSCMIVNTDAVHRLLKLTVPAIEGFNRHNENRDIDRLVEYISSLIVGVPVDRKILPYSSIINGPIDADKCDYLSRDSHVTRVPVAVDISRITQKLSVVRSEDINTSQLWHEDADDSIPFYELAMQDSAEKALFQLCIARTIMFDSVYYHHKVLTAETECRSLLSRLVNLDKRVFTTFDEILEHTDEDFNRYFFDSLRRERGEADCAVIDEVQTAFENLFNRRLAKRVICIMPDYLSGKQINKEPFFDNVITQIDSEEEKKLIDEIKKEYIRIREMLDHVNVTDEKQHIYMIQAPSQIFWHSKIQVPIDLRNGNKRDFKGYELVSSRETSSSSSYIVTDEEDRLLVCLAAEKVLYKIYHIRLREESLTCGKYDKEDINRRCKELFQKGYYDDAPELIRDNILHNHISKAKIRRIESRFGSYEGPGGYKVTEERAGLFFRQVMAVCEDKNTCHTVVDGIYRLLTEGALFFDRKYIGEHIEQALSGLWDGSGQKLYVVPLGKLLDSAKHMSYFWNDVKLPNLCADIDCSLEEILKIDSSGKIIFFDDGAYSGTQLISIMQEYMGAEVKKTTEEHVKPLSHEGRQKLSQKKIIFFFLAFNASMEAGIRRELQEIGLKNVEFVYVQDLSSKRLEPGQGIFKDEEQRELVKKLLWQIGYSVMKDQKKINGRYKSNWSEKRVKDAALGYNDAQQMVILKSSVPTYTITAFWEQGKCNGFMWEPLFKRTKK